MTSRLPLSRIAISVTLGLALTLGGCIGRKHRPVTPTVGNRIPILSRIESGAKVDPALDQISVVVPVAELNPEWPQAGNTPGKAYGNLALGDSPGKVWSAAIAGSSTRQRLAAAPVVGDGRLFVMDTDGVVHAFNAHTGKPEWTAKFLIRGDSNRAVFGGGASFDGGKVYITTGLGEVAALDAATGKRLWEVDTIADHSLTYASTGAPQIAKNVVIIGSQPHE